MLSVLGSIVGLIFKTRAGTTAAALALAAGGLWVWHTLDKSSAVRTAVIEYVARTELETARAAVEEANRRAEIAEQATAALEERAATAERDAELFQQEIRAYERENEINPDGLVDPGIFERLRSD